MDNNTAKIINCLLKRVKNIYISYNYYIYYE